MIATTAGLRRFLVRAAPQPQRCELCATPISAQHPHLVQVTERRMRCACRACGLLFDAPGTGDYRRVPDRCLLDATYAPTAPEWDALGVPVGVVFFLHSTATGGVVACYPGPAGATESELPLDAWATGVGASPLAAELTPDVEALLLRRDPPTALLVPIDACYRLVGLARRHWRGFDGGAEAREAIDGFFADALQRARTLKAPS